MAKKKKPEKKPAKKQPAKLEIPRMNLLLPLTPFERRMAALSLKVPPPPGDPETNAKMKRMVDAMQGDLQFRALVKRNIERIPH